MTFIIEYREYHRERWHETFRSTSETEARCELWRLVSEEQPRMYRIRSEG